MLRKINLFIFFICAFILTSQSQEKIKEYEPPKVMEGSNLLLYTNPNIQLLKDNQNNSNKPVFGYNFDLSSNYSKWRFSDRTDYTVKATINSLLYKSSYDVGEQYFSAASIETKAGISYYLQKNKLFIGTYTRLSADFNNHTKPYFNSTIYPYVGFGRITDAFIVNETSNFENVLKDEKYITRSFDKRTRMLLNSLLDKRNGSVFSSLFKDDAEIEFFTALEKLMLEEKIIDKPLNARVTMKLYQTLYDRNFILFPLYKGYQVQAENKYTLNNSNDTLKLPQTLSLNTVYGLPFNNSTALLFTANFVFPLNSEYRDDNYSFNMHTPLFLRSEFEQVNNFNIIEPRVHSIYREIYSYKFSGEVNIFHYFTPNIGFLGRIEYTGAHRKDDNYTDYIFITNAGIIVNIINKLRLSSGVNFNYTDTKEFYVNFGNSISYYIF